jgi:hypothetical protein
MIRSGLSAGAADWRLNAFEAYVAAALLERHGWRAELVNLARFTLRVAASGAHSRPAAAERTTGAPPRGYLRHVFRSGPA